MDLAERIIQALDHGKFEIFRNEGEINIVYLEGSNSDGSPNKNEPNKFNDQRIVITFKNDKPIILGQWLATTEPGTHWVLHPLNPAGAARIKLGQYKAWQVGIHHLGKASAHEALVQTGGQITVYRDKNQDNKRDGDKEDTGFFAVNQHWGYNNPIDDIKTASAGCLVGRTVEGHKEFMSIVKSDPRFKADKKFVFSTTILPVSSLIQEKK
jgi:hypothetical protein